MSDSCEFVSSIASALAIPSCQSIPAFFLSRALRTSYSPRSFSLNVRVRQDGSVETFLPKLSQNSLAEAAPDLFTLIETRPSMFYAILCEDAEIIWRDPYRVYRCVSKQQTTTWTIRRIRHGTLLPRVVCRSHVVCCKENVLRNDTSWKVRGRRA